MKPTYRKGLIPSTAILLSLKGNWEEGVELFEAIFMGIVCSVGKILSYPE